MKVKTVNEKINRDSRLTSALFSIARVIHTVIVIAFAATVMIVCIAGMI